MDSETLKRANDAARRIESFEFFLYQLKEMPTKHGDNMVKFEVYNMLPDDTTALLTLLERFFEDRLHEQRNLFDQL